MTPPSSQINCIPSQVPKSIEKRQYLPENKNNLPSSVIHKPLKAITLPNFKLFPLKTCTFLEYPLTISDKCYNMLKLIEDNKK